MSRFPTHSYAESAGAARPGSPDQESAPADQSLPPARRGLPGTASARAIDRRLIPEGLQQVRAPARRRTAEPPAPVRHERLQLRPDRDQLLDPPVEILEP